MTSQTKRSLLKLGGYTALAAAAALVGCGKKDEPAAPTAAAPASAAAPAAPGPLKIAFAYVGPVGDGGWTFAHDHGRKALEKEFGDKVTTSFVENVPEAADAERVFRDMVGPGQQADLRHHVRLHGADAEGRCRRQGREVRARHRLQAGANMRTYDSRTYEGAYLAGIIAGGMTKNNTLGVVGSIPIPEVDPQHQLVHARRAERQPEDQDQGGVGQQVVRPAEGNARPPQR